MYLRVCVCHRRNMHFLCSYLVLCLRTFKPLQLIHYGQHASKIHILNCIIYMCVYTAENKEDLPNLGQLDLFQTP